MIFSHRSRHAIESQCMMIPLCDLIGRSIELFTRIVCQMAFAVKVKIMNEVIVLYDGYSRQLDSERMEANCTCTLIKGAEDNIVVDTMTAWDGDSIVSALAENGVQPSEVNYVVCTHSHADHIGCNYLFKDATHIVGLHVHNNSMFYEKGIKQKDYELCKGVRVTATPGHSHEDVTVLVEDNREDGICVKYAITGDLFEKEEDLVNPSLWQDVGAPELRHIQASTRLRIFKYADWIVPGHGPMFKTSNSLVQALEKQISEGLS